MDKLDALLQGLGKPKEKPERIQAPNGYKHKKDAPLVKVELTDEKTEKLILLGYYGELKRRAYLKSKREQSSVSKKF